MKYILSLISLILTLNISSFAMSHYNQRLTFPTHVTEKYDDARRWISIEDQLFDTLLETAELDNTLDKTELINLKRKIVAGIVNLRSEEKPSVLLTQKEFYMGLLQHLPWDGTMVFGSAFVRILIQNNPKTLQISTSHIWHPNDVRFLE